MLVFESTPRGLYCECGDFYIDAWLPVENALITHAHADHARWGHKKYLAHGYTASFTRYLGELGLNAHELHTEFGGDEAVGG